MRIIFTLLFLVCSIFGFSQEKHSLLWEISGNDLKQSSYLYGTMHVSKRIAFRLDDVFYEALDKSEVIALESDPSTWLDNEDALGTSGYGQGNGFVSKGFYRYPFMVKHPKKEELGAYIAFEDRRINSILYRTNEYSQNFEEETYLDMFIYQAGKKFGKPVVALEDLEESSALVGRASMNAVKPKPDEWLQKKMQQQDPMSLLQDAYRNRNINMLDSIDKAMYTQHYLKNMLFIRNQNMADKLDSVVRTAKVFAGIGAAHLPGEKGVITMLREKGYTVKPLVSRTTSRGKRIKTKIDTALRENTYTTVQPDDGFFSIALPNKLYPITENTSTTYIAPNLVNGSFLMLNRIPVFSYLKKEDSYTLDDIDKSGLIREAYRIDGITPPECRSIFVDWAIKLPKYDALYCANMIHIAPWAAAQGLARGAGALLSTGGLLILYGPYFEGKNTAQSNLEFDLNLKQRNALWGVRELEEVKTLMATQNLALKSKTQMPKDNLLLVFEYLQPKDLHICHHRNVLGESLLYFVLLRIQNVNW